MKLSAALLINSLAMGVYAAPVTPYARPMGINSTLIMKCRGRFCNEGDTASHWSFTINVNGHRTDCNFNVKGSCDIGAQYSDNTGKKCGNYNVSSSWSGQLGDKDGFSMLSIANYPEKTITWPAYRDDQQKEVAWLCLTKATQCKGSIGIREQSL